MQTYADYIDNGIVKITNVVTHLSIAYEKVLSDQIPQKILLLISKDCATLEHATNRIELEHPTHSRHFCIDRSGLIVQLAPVTKSIKVVPENWRNSGMIAIEFINCGELYPYKSSGGFISCNAEIVWAPYHVYFNPITGEYLERPTTAAIESFYRLLKLLKSNYYVSITNITSTTPSLKRFKLSSTFVNLVCNGE